MIRWKRQRMPCRFPTTIFIACHTATVLPSTLLRRLRTTFGTEIPRYYGRFQPHYRSITAITAAFARSQTPLPCSFLSPPLSLPPSLWSDTRRDCCRRCTYSLLWLLSSILLLFRSRYTAAKYCDDRVCLCVCVCLSVYVCSLAKH